MNNLNIIKSMKKYITSRKPTKDKYGTVTKAIYLRDHVLYALLREKHDYRSCSQDPKRAEAIAEQFLAEFDFVILNKDSEKKGYNFSYFHSYMKKQYDLEITIDDLVAIKESIEKQLEKHQEKLAITSI